MDLKEFVGKLFDQAQQDDHALKPGKALYNALSPDVQWQIMGYRDYSDLYKSRDEFIGGPVTTADNSMKDGLTFQVNDKHIVGNHTAIIEMSARDAYRAEDGSRYVMDYCWVLHFEPKGDGYEIVRSHAYLCGKD